MAAATHMLKTRVTEETKQIVEAITRQQQLTESAWLRRLVLSTLQSAGAVPTETRSAPTLEAAARGARLMIRLVRDDQLVALHHHEQDEVENELQ